MNSNLPVLQNLPGHTEVETVLKYLHPLGEAERIAVEELECELFGTVRKKRRTVRKKENSGSPPEMFATVPRSVNPEHEPQNAVVTIQ